MRRGEFNLLGRRLNFTRGEVSLENANTIDPRLDFLATATVHSTTIEVAITGTSRAPRIAVTSNPSLPQDEAMAMLLFGKPASGLSAFEILSAAQALVELAGGSSGDTGFWSRMRKGLGLDRLGVESGSSSPSNSGVDSVALGAGRYVAPGVYVGARQGAGSGSTRGVVELEVLKNTKIEADIGADANSRLGVKMEWDY
jgi:translocation and assembly module TamB